MVVSHGLRILKRLLRWFCNVRAYTNIIVQEMAVEVWNVGRVRGVGGW
jgi:hypothetical protein